MQTLHLSNCYFDLEKRKLLSLEEIHIFSKVVNLANTIISNLNNSNMDISLKQSKFNDIKFKISNCYSLSLALEYYLDLESELYRLESNLDEYSGISYNINPKDNKEISIVKNKKESICEVDNINSKEDDKENYSCTTPEVEANPLEDIDYYINKYNSKTNASKEYILDVISNIRYAEKKSCY